MSYGIRTVPSSSQFVGPKRWRLAALDLVPRIARVLVEAHRIVVRKRLVVYVLPAMEHRVERLLHAAVRPTVLEPGARVHLPNRRLRLVRRRRRLPRGVRPQVEAEVVVAVRDAADARTPQPEPAVDLPHDDGVAERLRLRILVANRVVPVGRIHDVILDGEDLNVQLARRVPQLVIGLELWMRATARPRLGLKDAVGVPISVGVLDPLVRWVAVVHLREPAIGPRRLRDAALKRVIRIRVRPDPLVMYAVPAAGRRTYAEEVVRLGPVPALVVCVVDLAPRLMVDIGVVHRLIVRHVLLSGVEARRNDRRVVEEEIAGRQVDVAALPQVRVWRSTSPELASLDAQREDRTPAAGLALGDDRRIGRQQPHALVHAAVPSQLLPHDRGALLLRGRILRVHGVLEREVEDEAVKEPLAGDGVRHAPLPGAEPHQDVGVAVAPADRVDRAEWIKLNRILFRAVPRSRAIGVRALVLARDVLIGHRPATPS